MPVARWSLLSRGSGLARSSHCLSVSPTGRAALYGGELKPRTPVDADQALAGAVHIFQVAQDNVSTNGNWQTLTAKATPSIPEPRVGAATTIIGDNIYLWGGRGGVDMAPIAGEQAGIWTASLTDKTNVRWERLQATNENFAPQATSYHAIQSHGTKVYVHAGCPASGRISDLHSFDVESKTWSQLTPGPDPGRGGTVLASTKLNQGDVFLRFAGFAGHELGSDNTLDIYDIRTDTWRTVVPSADPQHGRPGPRSVHGFVGFSSPKYPSAVALLYHGEREASKLGHAGAGAFWSDVWLLQETSTEPGLEWQFVPVEGKGPEERGWFPAASFTKDGVTKVVLQGGLLSSNGRSDELWLLEID